MRKFGWGALMLALMTGLLLGFVVGVALPLNSSGEVMGNISPTPQSTPDAAVTPTPGDSQPTATPDSVTPTPGTQQQSDVKYAVQKAYDGVVSIVNYGQVFGRETAQGSGSGFVYSQDGYIVTNHHVIEDATRIVVLFNDGTQADAELVGSDDSYDIALLKVNKTGLTPVIIGNSDAVEMGDQVIAIGDPFGYEYAGSITVGYVSAVDRALEQNGVSQKFLQIDAALNPGNSGGPLVNLQGEVIGINTMKSRVSGYDEDGSVVYAEGMGFSIPINTAVPIIEQIRENGSIQRPGVGITGAMLTEQDAELLNVPLGIYVTEVAQGGPCDQAGVLPYDVITKVDGREVTSFAVLKDYVFEKQIGDVITLTIYRGGEYLDLEITLAPLDGMQYEE